MTQNLFHLTPLPTDTVPRGHQVYLLPELNAAAAFQPVRGSRRLDGKITVLLNPEEGLSMDAPAWTSDVCWQDGTLSLRAGQSWFFHRSAEETLAQVRADHANPTVIDDQERHSSVAGMYEKQLTIPTLLHENPPVWMVRTSVTDEQNGNLSGKMMLTFGRLSIPGSYAEKNEPVNCVHYRIEPEQASLLPPGTVFSRSGQWNHRAGNTLTEVRQ